MPLVTRALKVLIDREVSPQLGLLKSTLLQLDSSFSERDYGVSTFREFAEKLAEQGLVSLKQQGRSTLVELPDSETQSSADRCSGAVRAARGELASATHGLARSSAQEADAAARDPRTARFRTGTRGAVAWRRCGAGSQGARRGHHAAAMADVSATVQAVPEERAAGFRRAEVRIDRRLDARLSEGRPPASRTRSPGRPARVCRRQRIASGRCRTGGAWRIVRTAAMVTRPPIDEAAMRIRRRRRTSHPITGATADRVDGIR